MRAMNLACRDVVLSDNAMHEVNFAGRTDWSILDDVMRKYGKTLDPPLLEELRQRYVQHLVEEIKHRGEGVKDVMPGIRELLEALQQRDDVALALLTGNFIESARIKLEHFDLWKYFPCGAFGGDAANRNELVPVAMTRARACGIADVAPENVLVVGDTPNDVECALVAGARPVAVATGGYSMEELRASGADIVFKDLSDTEEVLKLL
jgi:phosphoglycolate phosphatase-like HAD superfamily hydrolase